MLRVVTGLMYVIGEVFFQLSLFVDICAFTLQWVL